MAARTLVLAIFLLCSVASSKPEGDSVVYQQAKESVTSLGRTRWLTFKSILYQRIGVPIHRHIVRRLAAGVYAIGRFFNDAGRRSLQSLNGALPRVGEPTIICERLTCSFCTFTSVQSFQFDKDVCLELALHPKDLGVGVRLILDGSTFTEYHVSWKRPSDVKLDLGGICNVFFRTTLYNNYFQNNTMYTCVSLELDFPFNSLLYLEMGCYYLGPEGVGRWIDDDLVVEKKQLNATNLQSHKMAAKHQIDLNAINREEKELTESFYREIEDGSAMAKLPAKTANTSETQGLKNTSSSQHSLMGNEERKNTTVANSTIAEEDARDQPLANTTEADGKGQLPIGEETSSENKVRRRSARSRNVDLISLLEGVYDLEESNENYLQTYFDGGLTESEELKYKLVDFVGRVSDVISEDEWANLLETYNTV